MLLLIEFFDELVSGAWTAAWPLIRSDLGLSYVEVGILLSLPHIVGSLIEVPLGLLGDAWDRRTLVRAGGAAFVVGIVLAAASHAFAPLLLAIMLVSPASGAFVGLSQATLMDAAAARREVDMARWALAGSLGMVLGPAALAAAKLAGVGWRVTLLACAVVGLVALALAWRRVPAANGGATPPRLADAARGALRDLRRGEVLRWLGLIQVADLMLDVLYGFLALYFVDIVGASGAGGALAVLVWTGVGLAGDALLVPLLPRIGGARWVRASAAGALLVFPVFLLVDGMVPKLVVLGVLGILNSGWYAILAGRLYDALPGRSGSVMTLSSLAGMVGASLPFAVGVAAEAWGLGPAMWLLLGAPVGLLLAGPRQ